MIRNYEYPEGTIVPVDVNWATTPVFSGTTNGGPYTGSNGQRNAITTIAFCNTATPNPLDETVDSVDINVYIVRQGKTQTAGNRIVSGLTIPAGETVFFAEERIVLEEGDEIYVEPSLFDVLAVTVSALEV